MGNSKIIIIFLTAFLLAPITFAALPAASDYFVYGFYNISGAAHTSPGGFIDETNAVGRGAGKHYLVTGGCLIEVTANGNPALHPNDAENQGPVAPRSFNVIKCGGDPGTTVSAYHIDETGIYYGPKSGIIKFDFDWNPQGTMNAPNPPGGTQTFARNYDTGDFWCGTAARKIFRWKPGQNNWQHMFTYPNMQGSHHDGMTYANGSLFISDMTSDHILQYRLDESGNPIDPGSTPFNKFDYTADPVVENMGIGPFNHIWVYGGQIYELGGGKLQQYLNKGPEVDLFIDADEGPAPFTVEIDGSGSSDQDGWIAIWEWDFDNDGEPDLSGDSALVDEAFNVGAIPSSDPNFTCGTGQDLNIWDTFYCKYPSLESSVDSWFANVENFKNNDGINSVESLINQRFDSYIGGGTPANKIQNIRRLTEFFRDECTNKTYYTPPVECSTSCSVNSAADMRFDKGPCMTELGVKSTLDNYASPLSSYYSEIYQLSLDKGIDPAVALAFFAISSNYGRGFDQINWTYMTPGNYTVQLTVYDNNMVSASDTAPITVLVPPNRAPFAAFNALPTSGFADLSVELDASPSHDPDGDNMEYRWDFDNDGTMDTTGKTVSKIFTSSGEKKIKLVAIDPSGLFSEATISINVYTQSGVTKIIVEETAEGENSKVSVECTEALPLKVSLYKVEGNESILLEENKPYTCNSGNFMPIGPELEAGVYLVNAKTNQADCQNCIVSLYYVIKAPQSEVRAPEVNPVLTVFIAFAVLAVVKKNGN